MQTLIHVYCTKGKSLREAIGKDTRIEKHQLCVLEQQRSGRVPGWLKLRSTAQDRAGAINVQWDAGSMVLKCRVINKGSGKPNLIVGDFLEYLFSRYRPRVRAITILPG